MRIDLPKTTSLETLHVLLIGNNPIEMGAIIDKLNKVRIKKIVTEIAFDLKTISERLVHFKPDYILIDDNIDRFSLMQIVASMCSSSRTKNIPVTVLKNSNYQESFISFCNLDYVLKQHWNADSLFVSIRNSIKLRRTQVYSQNMYKKRRRLALR